MSRTLLLAAAAAAALVPAARLTAQTAPGDTYFSLAVTDDSHNHSGAKRLFLDFQTPPFSAPDIDRGVVVSQQVSAGAIVLDGDASDWGALPKTPVTGLVQSNYPLSEFLDAVRTELKVASAWDASYVYLMVQWQDAGYVESTRFKKWIYGDQGGGESGWNPQVLAGATPGAPNDSVVNKNHILAGSESEDRVFAMFPIVDTEGNFTAGGAGCALYCHGNLEDETSRQNYTGTGYAVMHTNIPGDTADIWHWKAARTGFSGYADDKYIVHAIGNSNGRMSDAGSAAYTANSLSGGNPAFMHFSGLGFTGNALFDFEAVPFSGTPTAGDEIPANLSTTPAGSRGDVEAAGAYDAVTHSWTVEFRRLRDTGNADDHSFNGPPAAPPTSVLVSTVDPAAGATLYDSNCIGCHDTDGLGREDNGMWVTPRVQRTSGSMIQAAIATLPAMSPLVGTLNEQEMEDIAAFLQTRADFRPQFSVHDLAGGSVTTLQVDAADPGAQVYFLYSLQGSGPTFTGFGFTLDLSQPIEKLGPVVADAGGQAVFQRNVPARASGKTVWLQAVQRMGPDFTVTNLIQTVIQ